MKQFLVWLVIMGGPVWGGISAPGDTLPWPLELGSLVMEAPATPGRHIEALGERGGMWGSLEGGMEAWAYPFKLFDDLRVSVTDLSQGDLIDLWGTARTQRATPHMAQLDCVGAGWRVTATLFYPRSTEAGVILMEVESDRDLELAVRFRPSLAPMLMEGGVDLARGWDEESKSIVIRDLERGAELRVSSPIAVGRGTSREGEEVLRLRPPAAPSGQRMIPVYFSAGWTLGPSASELMARLQARLPRLFSAARRHYDALLSAAPRVESPDPSVNEAMAWSVVSLDQLRVHNPFLGHGLVSGYSSSKGTARPRYGWFFEEPTLTSLAFMRVGLSGHVKEALRFLQRYQREDGKTVHEVTQSLRYHPDFFETYRYAYMHTDGAVYYLLAYGHYYQSTGDLAFIHEEWDRIRRTLDWCFTVMDPDDGLLMIQKGDWGSAESSTAVLKDTQLEGIWVRALKEVERLASAVGDDELALRCRTIRAKALVSLEEKLWDEAAGNYVWGIGRAGERLGASVPHHAISFWLSGFRPERVRMALERFASSDFRTDWGVRSLSLSDAKYDPAGYQTGSVWPVWNAGVIVADYRHGRASEAFRNWHAMVRARSLGSLGPMPEVLNGGRFELLEEAVPHQMFSELSVVNGFYDGLLGLEVDVPEEVVRLSPSLPPTWDSLRVTRIPVGSDHLDLDMSWDVDRVRISLGVTGGVKGLRLSPRLPAGAVVRWVKVAGEKVPFGSETNSTSTVAILDLPGFTGRKEVEIRHTGGVECMPIDAGLEPGSESQGLRMIRAELNDEMWEMTVEGRPGIVYPVQVWTRRVPRRASDGRIAGATASGFRVEMQAPETSSTNAAGYARWVATVQFQSN